MITSIQGGHMKPDLKRGISCLILQVLLVIGLIASCLLVDGVRHLSVSSFSRFVLFH